MIAKLIGEKSAGMTAVEIYNGKNELVWSHMYFKDGASSNGYFSGLCQVVDDMIGCADIDNYDGCDHDDDGEVILYDDNDYTGIIIEYNGETKKWTLGNIDKPRYLGQSAEIVDALMIAGLIDKDADHDDNITNLVNSIAKYIALITIT